MANMNAPRRGRVRRVRFARMPAVTRLDDTGRRTGTMISTAGTVGGPADRIAGSLRGLRSLVDLASPWSLRGAPDPEGQRPPVVK